MTENHLVDKYFACIDALDENKVCSTCKYDSTDKNSTPCKDCYNLALGFPIDPTNWESKNE